MKRITVRPLSAAKGPRASDNRRLLRPQCERLEPRLLLHAELSADDFKSLFDTAAEPELAADTVDYQADVPGGDHTFKIRIGTDARRSMTAEVGSTPDTSQLSLPLIIRRFLGDKRTLISVSVSLIDGNPEWWSAQVSERVFALGRAPTRSSADFDFPGQIGLLRGDGDIDGLDLLAFEQFYTGSGVPLSTDRVFEGIKFDFDGDLDVDDDDRTQLISQFTGPVGIPWNKSVDLLVDSAPETPEGASAKFRIIATNIGNGESHTTFAHVVKNSSAPRLGMSERLFQTLESDTKLSYGRNVSFDLKLENLGADVDIVDVEVVPVPGFSTHIENYIGIPQSRFLVGPSSLPRTPRLVVQTPLNWPKGSEQTITVTARSQLTGMETSQEVKIIQAGALWNPSDLLSKSGRRHDVGPGGTTTFGFTVTNTTSSTRTFRLFASPFGPADGWQTQFDRSNVTLQPGGQAFVTMTVNAPENAALDSNAQWVVWAIDGIVPVGVNLVGTHVDEQPRIIYVAIDGLNREYLQMNGQGTGAGSDGDWLMPRVREFMEGGTTYANARSIAPHVTDPNHIASISGSYPGTTGAHSVNIFYEGAALDGTPQGQLSEHLGPELLRYGADGAPIQTVFDVAKQVHPTMNSAFATSKGWMASYFDPRNGGSADVVVEGRTLPIYIDPPPVHAFGDPPSDEDPNDPRYEQHIGNWGLVPGYVPSDRWVMDSALKILAAEDPNLFYILLGGVDESSHAFGSAAYLEEWDDQGTESIYDDVNRVNPRVNREDSLDVVREADELFGNLLDELDRRGILDETYVVFQADHSIVNHNPHFLDLAKLLEQYGYAQQNDFQLLARSGGALIFDVAPEELAHMEDVLETGESIAPGLDTNPWVVLNRAEMQTGVDERTGRRVAPPGALYSEFYVNQQGGAVQWPEFFVLLDGNWSVEYRQFFGGEDARVRAEYVGGHGGPATAQIPLILSGPQIPAGQLIRRPVQNVDIAPTLYALLGWPTPDHVEGKVLPGIDLPAVDTEAAQLRGARAVFGRVGPDDLADLALSTASTPSESLRPLLATQEDTATEMSTAKKTSTARAVSAQPKQLFDIRERHVGRYEEAFDLAWQDEQLLSSELKPPVPDELEPTGEARLS